MPTYDYRCDACGHEMDQFQGIKEAALKKCPSCGKNRLRRLIGSGAGIIFKGSGFYETDYKRSRSSTSKEGPNEGVPKKDGESKPAKAPDASSASAPSTPAPASGSKRKKGE